MKPDAAQHNPDPEYLRGLLASAKLSQQAAAKRIGISARVMRYYLSGDRDAPYLVQYALEQLLNLTPEIVVLREDDSLDISEFDWYDVANWAETVYAAGDVAGELYSTRAVDYRFDA